jgi:hypothetical protein
MSAVVQQMASRSTTIGPHPCGLTMMMPIEPTSLPDSWFALPLPSQTQVSKALLRPSQASGLHPTLSGLEEVGQQVAAGVFSIIFKGLVEIQCVSVKFMRLSSKRLLFKLR